jgi:hypothetical protein
LPLAGFHFLVVQYFCALNPNCLTEGPQANWFCRRLRFLSKSLIIFATLVLVPLLLSVLPLQVSDNPSRFWRSIVTYFPPQYQHPLLSSPAPIPLQSSH